MRHSLNRGIFYFMYNCKIFSSQQQFKKTIDKFYDNKFDSTNIKMNLIIGILVSHKYIFKIVNFA